MRNLWIRLATGDGVRKSRFHTYRGQRIDTVAFFQLPSSLWFTMICKLTGHRPNTPWLGGQVVRHLHQLIQPNWRVLEFGSGMSTPWLGNRCGCLTSLESDPMWHAKVKHRLLQQGLENVDYRQASSPYAAALSDLAPASFDLAIVDGVDRTDEMRNAIQLVRPGGFIYLDNSDFPDYREAEALLLASTDKAPRYFRDILPYSIVANEGVIIQTRPM